jgi:serine/threonine protein phosphatase PrpC
MLDKEQIVETLRNQPDPEYATKQLVELARQNGGQDNITVIIAHLDGSDTFQPGDTTEEMPPTKI